MAAAWDDGAVVVVGGVWARGGLLRVVGVVLAVLAALLGPSVGGAGSLRLWGKRVVRRRVGNLTTTTNDETGEVGRYGYNALEGEWIVVSRGGQILDGHHRWDELLRRIDNGSISPDTPIRIWGLE